MAARLNTLGDSRVLVEVRVRRAGDLGPGTVYCSGYSEVRDLPPRGLSHLGPITPIQVPSIEAARELCARLGLDQTRPNTMRTASLYGAPNGRLGETGVSVSIGGGLIWLGIGAAIAWWLLK